MIATLSFAIFGLLLRRDSTCVAAQFYRRITPPLSSGAALDGHLQLPNKIIMSFSRASYKFHHPITSKRCVDRKCLPGSERFEGFVDFLQECQDEICRQAEESDGKATFCVDRWERPAPSQGFGITRVLEGGDLLEKAACSVSVIRGVLTPDRAQSMSARGRASINPAGGQEYAAASMSLVFHSANPLVPTFRADVRYFEVAGEGWFGGGADLTPYYLNDADISGFHTYLKGICDRYDPNAYSRFKRWADEYFYIPMRKEHRGVGGIFFDDLDSFRDDGCDKKSVDAFVREVATSFMPSFLPTAERHGRETFTDHQRQWQLMRRGRYLEFNLLYDRGVKFGLVGGRVESIMVSAPPLVSWKYNYTPEAGSEEERLIQVLASPKAWAYQS